MLSLTWAVYFLMRRLLDMSLVSHKVIAQTYLSPLYLESMYGHGCFVPFVKAQSTFMCSTSRRDITVNFNTGFLYNIL